MRNEDTLPALQPRATPTAAPVTFTFRGQSVTARAGASVAAALFASGIRTLRTSPREHTPRGMFCAMGSCQECLVVIDSVRVLACRTPVADGLCVDVVPEAGVDE